MRNDCVFFCPIHVRYGELDPQGIVYNGNYTTYVDFALSEFFRSKGYTYKELASEYGSEICHRKNTFEFLSSAFESDILEVGLHFRKLGNKSFTLAFEIYRQGEDDLLVTGESVYVGYDKDNRSSRPITNLMRNMIMPE